MKTVEACDMITAAIYLRISQDREATELATDRQRDAIHKLLKERGWTTTPELEYKDVSVSASAFTKRSRGNYLRMIEDMHAGLFDAVVVWDIDRLTRRPAEIEQWIEWTGSNQVVLVAVTEHVDTSTPAGRLHLRIKGDISAHESEQKSLRIKAQVAQDAAKGIPNSGVRPFGYKNRTELDPAEVKWLKWMHKTVISGASSLHGITRELNAKKVLTSTGKSWTSTQVRSVLLRERNAGLLNGKPSTIKAAVTEDEHKVVKAILEGNRVPAGRKVEKSLLSGLMVCSVCGEWMVAKAVTAKGVRAKFYMCNSRVIRNHVSDGLRHVSVKADLAEEKVWARLMDDFLNDRIGNTPPVDEARLIEYAEALVEVDRQTATLNQVALMPGANLTDIGNRLKTLDAERKAIRLKQDTLPSYAVARPAVRTRLGELSALNEWWTGLSFEEQRRLIRSTYEIEVVKGGKGAKRVTVAPRGHTSEPISQ